MKLYLWPIFFGAEGRPPKNTNLLANLLWNTNYMMRESQFGTIVQVILFCGRRAPTQNRPEKSNFKVRVVIFCIKKPYMPNFKKKNSRTKKFTFNQIFSNIIEFPIPVYIYIFFFDYIIFIFLECTSNHKVTEKNSYSRFFFCFFLGYWVIFISLII